MSTIEKVLGEFIDAWNAGARPDVAAYISRVPQSARDDLAERLAAWLAIAPTPRFDASTRAALAREPALVAALEAAAALRAPLSERLPALRRRAGLAVTDVARRVVAIFSLEDIARTEDYLVQIERDELDERRLSNRLIDALAAILGADRDQLAPTPVAFAPGQAFFRAEANAEEWMGAEIDVLSEAALAPAPAPMDELDRLFLGGPGA